MSAVASAPQGYFGDREDRVSGAAAEGAERTVTLRNNTNSPIWVGATANADGSPPLTGLPRLQPGESATVTIPERSGPGHWRGKFFARQGCTGEEGTTFHCAVADCGPYADRCSTGEQPASLAEFNFDTADAWAPWYNVSYVNAVSVPITITPDGVPPPEDGGQCAAVGCPTDLLAVCPPENLTTDQVTGRPLVCVNPNRDAKTAYSQALTEKCPSAYSWSKHDAEAGNQVVRQCSECSGMTVTFHGFGAATRPASDPPRAPEPGPEASHDERSSNAVGKGVGLNPVEGASQALAASGAKWYHNWAATSAGVTKPTDVEFVPTIWGPGSVTEAELGNAAREGKNLLGFNEPDSPTQANMTPEQALDLWPQLQKTGLNLGAPAVATDADRPGGWLDRFMNGAQERGLRVDFIPVHWYGSDFSWRATYQLAAYLERVHERYNKPIWLTEYALIDFTQGTPRYPSEQEQNRFIKTSAETLERLDYVDRYAWFALSTQTSPTGLFNGATPNGSGSTYRNAD
ncbi:glycosyl hydrolase [Streptomyces sp. NBC_01723]|uniref:glycosyl hydrolase n=1 Tax=Streptomyces sp. NBC_01723 TaxID=2975921 RepID=UPI002E30F07F|nr:glycosyl hydrolase [Streptomyces sp. NBC_01723]